MQQNRRFGLNRSPSTRLSSFYCMPYHAHYINIVTFTVHFQFEILSNLQKSRKYLQTEILPQLKLSPPAVYNEKVQKSGSLLAGKDNSTVAKNEKSGKRRQLKEFKSKGVLDRFPLKSTLFAGPEKKR